MCLILWFTSTVTEYSPITACKINEFEEASVITVLVCWGEQQCVNDFLFRGAQISSHWICSLESTILLTETRLLHSPWRFQTLAVKTSQLHRTLFLLSLWKLLLKGCILVFVIYKTLIVNDRGIPILEVVSNDATLCRRHMYHKTIVCIVCTVLCKKRVP
jgi:hypothetical protein